MKNRSIVILILVLSISACSNPQPGPDKTAAGAVLGAAWGAGAGAVVGNQISYAGEGAAVGAGFGLVGGAMSGLAYDRIEDTQLEQEEELSALQMQNAANARSLGKIQATLDRKISAAALGGMYQVFFDEDATSLRAGAIANLQIISEAIKSNPRARNVHVVGHTDDTGSPEHNKRLAEARAREVGAYLTSRGISVDQIQVTQFGSERPIASNSTPVGRQLNRRVDVYVTN